jgi:hypothetical protein
MEPPVYLHGSDPLLIMSSNALFIKNYSVMSTSFSKGPAYSAKMQMRDWDKEIMGI